MGFIGGQIGGLAGQYIGGAVGGRVGGDKGRAFGRAVGFAAGQAGGEFLPFEHGGKVGHTGPAYLHWGEMVVPAKIVKRVSKGLKNKIKKGGGRNM